MTKYYFTLLIAFAASVASAQISQSVIGTTTFDLQSNTSSPHHLQVHPGGTISAVWTHSSALNTNFLDRGTGYNYFDGTTWGPLPTQRLELQRTGWPNMAGNATVGERIITHTSTGVLHSESRTPIGTGTWTGTGLPGAGGVWPRMVVGGANAQTIHQIYYQNTPGTNFEKVVYSRSQDNGATWDILSQLIPGTQTYQLDVQNEQYDMDRNYTSAVSTCPTAKKLDVFFNNSAHFHDRTCN